MTFDEMKKEINEMRKGNGWYYWSEVVEGKTIHIKGYKTWLQRYVVDGINYANTMGAKVSEFNMTLCKPFL